MPALRASDAGGGMITFLSNRLPRQLQAIASRREQRHSPEQSMSPFRPTRRACVVALALAVICCGSSGAQEGRRGFYTPPAAGSSHPVFAEQGMVVAQEKLAARIGAGILRQGGNAVDAAVATGFALAVTYPRAGNIGGGGFMLIHSADRNEDVAIDYRE